MVISVMTSSPKVVSSTSNAEMRKIKKPLIERKRRERINHSLAELKMLVLEARNKDESCYSKMEKADILEMTVDHLKELQAQTKRSIIDENIAEHIDTTYLHSAYPSIPKLKDNPIDSTQARDIDQMGTSDHPIKSSHHHLFLGYSECVQRVQECLETLNLKVSLRQSLMKHLQSYLPVRSTNASKIHQQNFIKPAQRSHKNRKVSANLKTKLQNPYHVQNACQQMMRDTFQNSNDHQRCSSFENLFFKNSIQVWRPWNTC